MYALIPFCRFFSVTKSYHSSLLRLEFFTQFCIFTIRYCFIHNHWRKVCFWNHLLNSFRILSACSMPVSFWSWNLLSVCFLLSRYLGCFCVFLSYSFVNNAAKNISVHISWRPQGKSSPAVCFSLFCCSMKCILHCGHSQTHTCEFTRACVCKLK